MVNNPSAVFRSYSFWSLLSGFLLLLQEIVPFWEGVVDDHTFTILGAAAMSLGLIGRFIDQGIAREQNRL